MSHETIFRRKLLDDIYSSVKNVVKSEINDADVLCLSCDGWTAINNDAIINFMIHTPQGVFFHGSIVTDVERHTSVYIASQMLAIIDQYGAEKFAAVTTDNAKNMKGAWRIIKEKYPWIECYGCIAHGANLLAHDICKCSSIRHLIE